MFPFASFSILPLRALPGLPPGPLTPSLQHLASIAPRTTQLLLTLTRLAPLQFSYNSCNVRRVKCSGDHPCRQCTGAQRECLYPEPIERVTIPRTELESLQHRCESLQHRCESLEFQLAATERGDRRPKPRQHFGSPPASSHADATTDAPYPNGDSQHAALRSACIDSGMRTDGASISRYHGETSGGTFLNALKDLIMLVTPLARLLDGDFGKDLAGTASLSSLDQHETHETHKTHQSCVIGRPPAALDDVITLPLPRECLYVTRLNNFPHRPWGKLITPSGLRAHIELRRISDYLVDSDFREAGLPDPWTKATVRVAKALEMLEKWRVSLPPILQIPEDPLTLMPVDLFTQASSFGQGPAGLLSGAVNFGQDWHCWALHMGYNEVSRPARRITGGTTDLGKQLVILAVQPTMLMAVWKAVSSIVCAEQPFDIENQPHIERIRACSDAARRNLRLRRLMRLHSPRQKLLLPDLHHIFNAAIVLIMHMVVFVNLRTQDLDDVGWALEVFEGEAETREYGRDCLRILHDFKYLAHQLRNPIHNPDTKQVLLPEGTRDSLVAAMYQTFSC